ncbi:MAG: hypothetical protein ACK40O_06810 [Allosphingosinicella sp.]
MAGAPRHRPLTEGELALLGLHFPKGALPLDRVRFCDGPGRHPAAAHAFRRGNTAITLGRTIYYGPGRHSADFSVEKDAARQGLFMHEMTHVWQWHRLGVLRFLLRYARDFIACRGDARAMYRYQAGVDRFADAMLEAQAQMVGDYAAALVRGDAQAQARIGRSLAGSGFYGL